MKIRILLLFFVLAIFAVACNAPVAEVEPTGNIDLLATMVEATLAAYPTNTPVPILPSATLEPTPLPADTQTPEFTSVSGQVCYPADIAGDATLYFQNTTTGVVTEQSLSGRPGTYSVNLPAGTYIGYYWFNDFSFGAAHTGCVSREACASDAPRQFSLSVGQTLTSVDFCDLTHGPFDVPYPPGKQPQQTTGSISGSISYPFGDIPNLTVVAFNQTTGYWYYVQTAKGQSYYAIDNLLPPGEYLVVAYDGSHSGGSQPVTVVAGKSVVANITDWAGTYPANPLK